ncbi:hypothetical protein ABIA32_003361 [Streptacidiphilus sp. MAP12-20]|uniref:hypothetical protein n=1 Tax=Streptacidiphilus sp. MAP12-20 TaxID=3156299 RepID=UPI0035157342
MMATSSYPQPVAGDLVNTDALLGQDGFVGMKTGSDDAAGAASCSGPSYPPSGGVTVIGVVLGQRGRDLIAEGLSASNRRGVGNDAQPGTAHRDPNALRRRVGGAECRIGSSK